MEAGTVSEYLQRVGNAIALNYAVVGRVNKKSGASEWWIEPSKRDLAFKEEGPFNSFKSAEWALRRLYAREAIKVLREPSKEMKQAAKKLIEFASKTGQNLSYDAIWKAMIDEALK